MELCLLCLVLNLICFQSHFMRQHCDQNCSSLEVSLQLKVTKARRFVFKYVDSRWNQSRLGLFEDCRFFQVTLLLLHTYPGFVTLFSPTRPSSPSWCSSCNVNVFMYIFIRPCQMSRVTCHMSHVMFHMCQMYFFFTKWLTLSVEGL